MSQSDLEARILDGLGGDRVMGAELLHCYADWLERRLDSLSDRLRTGDTERLVAEARTIAITTSSDWASRITGTAMQLQIAGLRGSRGTQARLIGRLRSQVETLRAAAEHLSVEEEDSWAIAA